MTRKPEKTYEEYEKAIITGKGNIVEIANILGVNRQAIYSKLEHHPELQTILDKARKQESATDERLKKQANEILALALRTLKSKLALGDKCSDKALELAYQYFGRFEGIIRSTEVVTVKKDKKMINDIIDQIPDNIADQLDEIIERKEGDHGKSNNRGIESNGDND